MSFIVSKTKSVSTTIWNHKKKTIFGLILASYGANYFKTWNNDQKIRRIYSFEAKEYGDIPVKPTERLFRVTVLINKLSNQRKVIGVFEKNALPLLYLAGLDVNVIKTENEEELERIASVLDKTETDCIYIVGGDGTITTFLNGLVKNKEYGKDGHFFHIPVGIFPGGIQNESFIQLAKDIFSMSYFS